MRREAWFAAGEFTLLSRSGTTGWAAAGEYLFCAEFLFYHEPPLQRVVNLVQFPMETVYDLATMDMGRFCRKALISALFICKPPL